MAARRDPSPRKWGAYDGSGDDIVLSFAQYFARFVQIPKPHVG